MKLKKVIIPTLVLITMLAQTFPTFALTPTEATDLISESKEIVVEIAELDPLYAQSDELDEVSFEEDTDVIFDEEVGTEEPVITPRVVDVTQFSDYEVDLGGGILKNHWAVTNTNDIQVLLTFNGIRGIDDGQGGYKFEPNRSITTAELLSIILNTSNNAPENKAWPTGVMEKATSLSLIPEAMQSEANSPISREKMAMVLVNAAKSIRNEDVNKTYEASLISDLSQADPAYQSYIQTAYGMGLLAGTGSGYSPKNPTTRAETCAIVNRLFEYTDRVDNTPPSQEIFDGAPPQLYQALPDGSNVDSIGGMIFPTEGQINPHTGQVITRDPVTGVLGFGNGQKGGIFLGITGECLDGSWYTIEVMSSDSVLLEYNKYYELAKGYYEKKGDYVFWHDEWLAIYKAAAYNVKAIENPTNGMVADIHGNLIPSGTKSDAEAFFVYEGYWQKLNKDQY